LIEPKSVCPPKRFRWLVSKDPAGTVRIDILIKNKLPGLSRRILGELFSKQSIRINGRPAVKGGKASPGDLLEVVLPGPLNPFPAPDQSPRPPVYYEDSSLLVTEKPGLTPTHPLSPFETGTMTNTLVSHWPQVIGIGNKPLEPGLVHRLDKGTSGLIAIALSPEAWSELKKDLAARKWEKIYLAFIEGIIPQPLTLSLPLSHDSTDYRKIKVVGDPKEAHRGRIYLAETRIRPIRQFKTHTLLEVRLITGVTHQIRVHLAFLGHPVAGDTLYGSKGDVDLGLPSGRLFLHAHKLSLPHPITREQITCVSDLPEDLRKGLSRLESTS
jgi:23S rRNA pseudouridine1911/1915/1917 synthase